MSIKEFRCVPLEECITNEDQLYVIVGLVRFLENLKACVLDRGSILIDCERYILIKNNAGEEIASVDLEDYKEY